MPKFEQSRLNEEEALEEAKELQKRLKENYPQKEGKFSANDYEIESNILDVEKSEQGPDLENSVIELTPEVTEAILSKVQDINKAGVAYTVLGGFAAEKKGLDVLKNVLRQGLLGSPDRPVEDMENWKKQTRERNPNYRIWFNITGRDSSKGPVGSIKNSEYMRSRNNPPKLRIAMIFDIKNFSELTPGALSNWESYTEKRIALGDKDIEPEIKTFSENVGGRRDNIAPFEIYNRTHKDNLKGKFRIDPTMGFTAALHIPTSFLRGLVVAPGEDNNLELSVNEILATYPNDPTKLLPIYDTDGALLWPQKMSVEEVKELAKANELENSQSSEEEKRKIANKFKMLMDEKNDFWDYYRNLDFPSNTRDLIPEQIDEPKAQKRLSKAVAPLFFDEPQFFSLMKETFGIKQEYLKEALMEKHDYLMELLLKKRRELNRREFDQYIKDIMTEFGLNNNEINEVVNPEEFVNGVRNKVWPVIKNGLLDDGWLSEFAEQYGIPEYELKQREEEIEASDFFYDIWQAGKHPYLVDYTMKKYPMERLRTKEAQEIYLKSFEDRLSGGDVESGTSEMFTVFGLDFKKYVKSERFWKTLQKALETAKLRDRKKEHYMPSSVELLLRDLSEKMLLRPITEGDINNYRKQKTLWQTLKSRLVQ